MDDLKDIIARLERQRTAIDRALSALQGPGGSASVHAPAPSGAPAATVKRRRGGLTAAGRKRISEALKRRWAARRAGEAAGSPATRKSYGRKRATRRKAAAKAAAA